MYRMMVKIAWASLIRRPSRTMLVVLMITSSLWGLMLMQGIYEGMTEQMIDNALRAGSGHLTVHAKGYRLENDLKVRIRETDQLGDMLAKDSRVASHVGRIIQDGLIATASYSRNGRIVGIDAAAEQEHGRLHSYLRDGEYGFGARGKGVMVGAGLAEKMKLTVGRKLVISAQNIDNEVSSMALKVTGIFKSNTMSIDDSTVLVDRDRFRTLVNMPQGYSRFCILLHEEKDAAEVQEDLSQAFPELEVFRWDQIYPALMQGRAVMEGFSYVTYFLVFCVAALGIFGVLLVSVLERIREFGMMLAIGAEFSLIRKVVLFESLLIGLVGYGCGSGLGWATLFYFQRYGLDLSRFSAGLDQFGMDAITYAIIKPSYFLTGGLAVFTATLLSVFLPLRVLKKSKPLEAIRK